MSGKVLQQITEKVWKLPGHGNLYYMDADPKTIIDTGPRQNRQLISQFLSKLVPLDQVELVVFTHLHADHCGNFDLFPNAILAASSKEISDFEDDPYGTVLDEDVADKLKRASLVSLDQVELPGDPEIIPTPGHTRGSVSIWYPDQKILFSGDTVFPRGVGRMDLPTSVPEEMNSSLARLAELNVKHLCSGHDY